MILNVRSCICQKESPESRPLFYGSCHGVLCILLEVRSQQRWAVLQYCDKKNRILGNVVKEGGNSWEETVVENSLVKMEKKSEIFFCKKNFLYWKLLLPKNSFDSYLCALWFMESKPQGTCVPEQKLWGVCLCVLVWFYHNFCCCAVTLSWGNYLICNQMNEKSGKPGKDKRTDRIGCIKESWIHLCSLSKSISIFQYFNISLFPCMRGKRGKL